MSFKSTVISVYSYLAQSDSSPKATHWKTQFKEPNRKERGASKFKMTKGSRELQLDKRDKFFADPIFQDILAVNDKDLHRKLDTFKSRNALILANGQSEAAHNLQVTCSNDKFVIQLELPGFFPEDFKLKTRDDVIILEANHEGNADGGDEFTARKYTKEFKMPDGVLTDQLHSSYSADGILTIEAPRNLVAPEGAAISEAMAANSKAYTLDEGRTAVKEDSNASSQMIAASTQSPDGRTKSSMTYSSSNSSSSSMVTSNSGAGMPSMGMGMEMPALPGMPSMNMPPMRGMENMSLGMDDMMQKMMSGMNMGGPMGRGMGQMDLGMGGMGNSMSSMNQQSSSSFSSSSSSQQEQSNSMLGGPPMMGMGMPGNLSLGGKSPFVDIEEVSTAGTDISGPPRYTVTSPPPGPYPKAMDPNNMGPTTSATIKAKSNAAKGETMNHSVTGTADFKTVRDPQADHTVLLKLKEGQEYKLVLNMQNYSPDNITVKLLDRTISVLAHDGSTDDFIQKHAVPEGIDLDNLSSSFSEDGILVIRAPRLKK